MSRPQSHRGVRRAHSAPHSHRIRHNPSIPANHAPIYTGNRIIRYIDTTPLTRGAPDDREMIAPTPDLLNGRPILRRMRHYSDQPHRIHNKRPITIPTGSKPPLINTMTHPNRSGGSIQKRPSGRHHQSTGNLSQIQKPTGSLYQQPQAISRWYEFDDSSSQTSLASSDHTHPAPPPALTVQPPSSHDLSLPEPPGELESSKAYLDSYPPSPYEFDSPIQGPFSAAFEEMEAQLSPSSSFYGGASSVSGYIPSPLAIEGKMAVRSNVLHVPMSPISPYAVSSRPKSPAHSVVSQISTSTVSAPNRPPLKQSTPLGASGGSHGDSANSDGSGGRGAIHVHRHSYDQRDPTRINLMPKLDEDSKTGAQLSPSVSPKPIKSPGHNSQSLDCLDSSTTAMSVVGGQGGHHSLIGREGQSSSSPSLCVNGINPAIFRFPIPPPPPDTRGTSRRRLPRSSSHGPRSLRADHHHFQPRVLSKFPRSTSQMSVQSLSLRSEVSVSAGSVISTRSDVWGGRRFGNHGNNMRFSRQYYSYRRPHVPNPRGQRAYKSFRQELLMKSMR
jgi:hypothetical protein